MRLTTLYLVPLLVSVLLLGCEEAATGSATRQEPSAPTTIPEHGSPASLWSGAVNFEGSSRARRHFNPIPLHYHVRLSRGDATLTGVSTILGIDRCSAADLDGRRKVPIYGTIKGDRLEWTSTLRGRISFTGEAVTETVTVEGIERDGVITGRFVTERRIEGQAPSRSRGSIRLIRQSDVHPGAERLQAG